MRAYGAIELTESSPPHVFEETLSLSEARAFLNIAEESPTNQAQDLMLGGFITAARDQAEILQGRDLIPKQYDLYLDLLLGFDAIAGAAYPLRFNSIYNFGVGYEIELRSPLQSVDLFQYTDSSGSVTTLAENTDYILDKARSLVTPPWGKMWPFFNPQPTSAVLLRFTAGYPSTHPFWSNAGQRIIVGMKMLIAAWYENRIPFEMGRRMVEFPYAVSDLLSYGARPRVH